MAGPRTAFGDAIGLGINLFARIDRAGQTMIALTDGNDTASSVPPAEAARVRARTRGSSSTPSRSAIRPRPARTSSTRRR